MILALGEALERSWAVRRSLRGAVEHLDFAVHFSLTAPAVTLLALVTGLVVGLIAISVRALRSRLAGRGNRVRIWHSIGAVAVVATVVTGITLLVASPLVSLLQDRATYYANLPKANQWEALAQVALLAVVLPLVASLLLVDRLLERRMGRWWRIAGFAVLAVFGALAYRGDTNAVVGLSDDSMHLGMTAATVFSATACALIVVCSVQSTRMRVRLLLVTLAVSTLLAGCAAMRLGKDPVVAALFWTRGAIATRPALFLQRLADRDGDGFSSAFGGGDPDDGNPLVNALAREIPGDGIDQNGLEGDASLEASPDPTDPAAFPARPPAPGPGRRNVLFITIDTLRADHMSSHGYRRQTTPQMDAFASNGVLFERAVSQSTSTGHGFASQLTGAWADRMFEPAQPRLGRLLSDHGYRTAWLNSAPFLRFINRDQYWLHYRDIMGDGFTPIDNAAAHSRQAEELVDDTIAYLRDAPVDKPLFTWVHFRDPHALYIRHKEFDFGIRAIDRYDSEIAYTDHHLGRLFAYLEESGAMEDTLVIITSDHGESFGEHGDYTHHRRPYWTLANVPLIARWPGSEGVRVSSAAACVDIAPTIVNWAGIPVSTGAIERFDGIDMRWQAAQPAAVLADRATITESPRNCAEASFLAWSVVQGNLHLIYDAYGSRVELFDLAEDPFEIRNLATDRPEETKRMLGLLGRWLDRMSMRPDFTGWAQMQPSMWAAAPRYPPLPPRSDQRTSGGNEE